jgi:tetratricopeptide (TPR) repeat protein
MSDEFANKFVQMAKDFQTDPTKFVSRLEAVFMGNPIENGTSMLNYAHILFQNKYAELALSCLNSALKFFSDQNFTEGIYKSYALMGAIYFSLGQSTHSIAFSEKALKLAEESGDKAVMTNCYANIGAAYYDKGDFKKSIRYFETGLTIAIEINDRISVSACSRNLVSSYQNLGKQYFDSKQFDKSIEFYQTASLIAQNFDCKVQASKSYLSLGAAFLIVGDFNASIEFAEAALSLASEVGDAALKTKCSSFLATVREKLDEFNKINSEKR